MGSLAIRHKELHAVLPLLQVETSLQAFFKLYSSLSLSLSLWYVGRIADVVNWSDWTEQCKLPTNLSSLSELCGRTEISLEHTHSPCVSWNNYHASLSCTKNTPLECSRHNIVAKQLSRKTITHAQSLQMENRQTCAAHTDMLHPAAAGRISCWLSCCTRNRIHPWFGFMYGGADDRSSLLTSLSQSTVEEFRPIWMCLLFTLLDAPLCLWLHPTWLWKVMWECPSTCKHKVSRYGRTWLGGVDVALDTSPQQFCTCVLKMNTRRGQTVQQRLRPPDFSPYHNTVQLLDPCTCCLEPAALHLSQRTVQTQDRYIHKHMNLFWPLRKMNNSELHRFLLQHWWFGSEDTDQQNADNAAEYSYSWLCKNDRTVENHYNCFSNPQSVHQPSVPVCLKCDIM